MTRPGAPGADPGASRVAQRSCARSVSPNAGSIGLIVLAATLRIDEQGTVASAATAVGILPTAEAPPRRTVVFDRPYLLLVTDTATGEPLFLAPGSRSLVALTACAAQGTPATWLSADDAQACLGYAARAVDEHELAVRLSA
jgi:hypothetical protein